MLKSISTDEWHLYKSFLVLFFRNLFFSNVAGFLAGIFQRLITDSTGNFRTAKEHLFWNTFLGRFFIQVCLYSLVHCITLCSREWLMCCAEVNVRLSEGATGGVR